MDRDCQIKWLLILIRLHCFQCPTWCCKLVLSRPWFCHKNQSTTFSTKRIGSLYWSTHYTFWKQTPKPLPFKQLCTPTICKLTREQVTWGETFWCFWPKWQNLQENQKTSFDPWARSEEKLDRGHGVKLFSFFGFVFSMGLGHSWLSRRFCRWADGGILTRLEQQKDTHDSTVCTSPPPVGTPFEYKTNTQSVWDR